MPNSEPNCLLVRLLDPRGILCGGLVLQRKPGTDWPGTIESEVRRNGKFIRKRKFVRVQGTEDEYRELAAAANV